MVSEPRRRSYAAAVGNNGESDDELSAEQLPEQVPGVPDRSQQSLSTDEFENPLYLHITENANVILISPPLTENNYGSWSRSMKMALEVKNKFGLVDGSIPDPGKLDPQYIFWKRCNTILCSWILKSLSPAIAESVLYFEYASDIWSDLRIHFSQSDPHRIAELQNEIYNNKQASLTVNSYFTKCKSLWEQMSMMRPIPMCECNPRCSCTLVSKIRKEREDDCVIRFLEGLNDDYDSVKSGVLVLDHIPPIDKVFKLALKLERKLNGSSNHMNNELIHANAIQGSEQQTEEEIVIAASGFNSNNNGYKKNFGNGGKNVPNCTFCGMNGHTVDKCYKKHGYPPGWVPGYKNKSRQNQNQQGTNTLGSYVNQASDYGLSPEQFQRLVSLLQSQNGQGSSSTTAVTLNNPTLKPEFRKMAADPNEGRFLSYHYVHNSSYVWILDSAATDRICCSLDYFDNHHISQGTLVNLPNGQTDKVSHVAALGLMTLYI